jgi:hypothetical protein
MKSIKTKKDNTANQKDEQQGLAKVKGVKPIINFFNIFY